MKEKSRYIVFSTSLGFMGLAWCRGQVVRLWLPDKKRAIVSQAKAMGMEASQKVPGWVRSLAGRLGRYVQGKGGDFSQIPLRMDCLPDFYKKVFSKARRIPSGTVTTYGVLAKECGSPKAARAVGQAMAKNPYPILVPCHRVIGSNGGFVGFSAAQGISLKQHLLQLEGYIS